MARATFANGKPMDYPTIEPGTFVENGHGDRAYVDGDGTVRASVVERNGAEIIVARGIIRDLLVERGRFAPVNAARMAREGVEFTGESRGWGRSFRDYRLA
jgi:hypothetical protein